MLLKMRRHPLQPFPLISTHTSEGMSVEIRWGHGCVHLWCMLRRSHGHQTGEWNDEG
jgi:hypothetical protein